MPLLYYWRADNYRRDLDFGAGYHLNQASRTLHEIALGESLWAFTRARDGSYVLAAELVVRAKTCNPPTFRYGRYRVWCDLNASRYFAVDGQPSIEQVVRALSIKARAPLLGQSFQGSAAVRVITQQDDVLLRTAAKGLPLEPRARLVPEERLEAGLFAGDEDAVLALLRDEQPGLAQERREYLYKQAPSRNALFARQLQELYRGRCQLCGWNPEDEYGYYLCQGHHVQWLSRGGEDTLDNMLLLCPNHHVAVHRLDAPFDFRDGAFDFGTRREILLLNLHFPIS